MHQTVATFCSRNAIMLTPPYPIFGLSYAKWTVAYGRSNTNETFKLLAVKKGCGPLGGLVLYKRFQIW